VVAYAILTQVAYWLEGLGGFPSPSLWFHYVIGAIFGALVMAPYARGPHRLLRGLALAAASAAIYWLAVWFVTDGPMGYDSIVSFTVAGALAAVLCGVAVAMLAPNAMSGRLFLLTLLAGAVGGATFDLKLAYDQNLLVAHAAWQLLVCLALHVGLHRGPAVSDSAGERTG
jgi:hypothetical protein